MNEIQEKQFETVSDSDVLKVLETDSEKGLSSQEAADLRNLDLTSFKKRKRNHGLEFSLNKWLTQ